jgi:hypothetical protein
MATIAAIVGAAASAYGAYSTNKANQAASKASGGSGAVDITTTRKGDPNADPYRNFGMQQAAYAAYGYDPASGTPYAPAAAAPADTGDPRQAWRQQRRAAGKPGAVPGGSPQPAAPAPYKGMSQQTDDIRTQLMGLGDQEKGMYGTAQQYMQDTLAGTGEHNAYRPEAAQAARNIADDPGLSDYIGALRSQLGYGGAGAGGASQGHYYDPANVTYGGQPLATAANSGGATGVSTTLKDILAGRDPAGWAAMDQSIRDEVAQDRASQLRDLKAQAVGSGFYGGSGFDQAYATAVAQGDQKLAGQLAGARYNILGQALGDATQYDTSMADVAARAAATGASSASAAAALEQQRQLALYGDWGSALGQGSQNRSASASALGNLSGQLSSDQQNALGGINALGASRRSDLGAAGDLSLGSDNARNSYATGMANASVGRAQVRLGQDQLAWNQQQFYDPLNRTMAYGNALSLFYGGLGSETTQGTDRRNGSPAPYTNVAGAALQGAALGGQVGSLYQSQNPPPASTGGSNYIYNGGVNPNLSR